MVTSENVITAISNLGNDLIPSDLAKDPDVLEFFEARRIYVDYLKSDLKTVEKVSESNFNATSDFDNLQENPISPFKNQILKMVEQIRKPNPYSEKFYAAFHKVIIKINGD